jgi:hypothetical protein
MAALLIAWGVFALALIAHAILDTPRAPDIHGEDASAARVVVDEEPAGVMEAIAMSVF